MTEITTDSGLRYTDIQTGSGETATGKGQTAIVHYTGWHRQGPNRHRALHRLAGR